MLSDRAGVPLSVAVSAANTNDADALKPLVRAIPAIKSRRGPRRRRPAKLHADKAYGERTSVAHRALTRVDEAERASTLLHAKMEFLDLPDGQLTFDGETVSLVEAALGRGEPQLIITHFPQERGFGHQDHATLSNIVTTVALRQHPMATLIYAEPPVSGHLFTPNLFVDVTGHFETKLRALSYHRTEHSKSFLHENVVDQRARWWALQALGKASVTQKRFEAFYVAKGITSF